ncbi:glycosyltransferase [uncultured Polaribacter sp.]|uniref:CgeB family protein n=1 Tax=uncultured Polaribacter sp. TaxID=174711 RepID=UPI00262838F2|nr:glycosyltransferase [uncultured Polaribacter sp.]
MKNNSIRILISGSKLNSNVLGNYYYNHLFNSKNVVVEKLNFHDIHNHKLRKSFIYRLLFHFFPYFLIKRNNKKFVSQVAEFSPNYIVVFKGSEISLDSLKIIKDKGIKLLNYNLDHPFEYFSKGSGNKFVRKAIPFYDKHITYSKEIQKQLLETYKIKALYLPFGYELEESKFEELRLKDKKNEEVKACFVGNPDSNRAEIINGLADKQIHIVVFGENWNKFLKPSSYIEVYPQVNGDAYWETLAKYRVQINIFRPHNINSHNMRTFEVPAIGGIMLAPKSIEHEAFFKNNEDCFIYSNFNDLVSKVTYVLNLSFEEATIIRKNARKKSVSQGYSYVARTQELLTYLKNA